jgi:glycosyltransferase involved in cell wall biosynthesis
MRENRTCRMPPPVVALVGPVPPWRSGIADQDARLVRAIRALGVETLVVTHRRLYPSFLYPGLEDRGPGEIPGDLGEVHALLDGRNPFSYVTAARFLAGRGVSLAIFPWWTAFFAPHAVAALATLGAERPQATRLLLCHNVFDHEENPWKSALTRAVLRRGDRFVAQNEKSARQIAAERPDVPIAVVPHPSEPRAVIPDRAAARARLGVPADVPVFLFSGLLRPYKGWDVLLDAFASLRRTVPSARLVLAGEPWGKARALPRWAPAGVRLELRYQSEEERAQWFAAADAVVCPYRHATGSGIVADALAFGRPVIGSAVDGVLGIVEDERSGLLVSPGDADALAEAMRRFVRENLGPRLAAGAAHRRAVFSPGAHARRVLAAGGIDV